MGMSASQARLLSITTRLTNNEFNAQTITNSKLRLAQKSAEVSDEYMDALNIQKLMFGVYDADGNKTYTNLNANTLLSYGELKNQYALVNSSGQVLMGGDDIKKYVEAANLTDYLYTNGVAKTENPQYTKAMQEIYGNDYETLFNFENKNQWVNYFRNLTSEDIKNLKSKVQSISTTNDAEIFQNTISNWIGTVKTNPVLKNYESFTGVFGDLVSNILAPELPDFPTEKNIDSLLSDPDSLGNKFKEASAICYNNAINNGDTDCYIHVLAHLVDLKTEDVKYEFTSNNTNERVTGVTDYYRTLATTLGDPKYDPKDKDDDDKFANFIAYVDYNDINNSAICKNTNRTKDMAEVCEKLWEKDNNGKYIYQCLDDGKSNELMHNSKEWEKLLSNWKFVPETDENGNIVYEDGKIKYTDEKVLKSWPEKIVDLYYVIDAMKENKKNESKGKNYEAEGLTIEKLKEQLTGFQTKLNNILATETWKNQMIAWLDSIGDSLTGLAEMLENLPEPEIPDEKDAKYQWYVNIWYKMGSEDENTKGSNFKEIDANLMSNSDWLKFALEHGVLSLEQVKFNEKGSEQYDKMGTYDWVSTIYTSASDITQIEDETAIAIAEVKYKNALTEIENKDKKYEQDLKKLDTEHTALQTEYESLKGVVDKNIERSFKAFS